MYFVYTKRAEERDPEGTLIPQMIFFNAGIVNEFLFVFTGKEKGGQSDQKCRL